MPSNEPKTRKSTTAAARMPRPSPPTLGAVGGLDGLAAQFDAHPVSGSGACGGDDLFGAATGRTLACWSKVIVAKATCPLV